MDEEPEREDCETSPDRCTPCTNPNCSILLQLAWDEIERLQKELDEARSEFARLRIELAHIRAATDQP